jgi:uncharacterized membrane protein YphA (DoxX/SURF4 family)
MGGFRAVLDGSSILLALVVSSNAALIGRYVLAVVFAIAGFFKLQHPRAAGQSMVAFGVTKQVRRRNGLVVGALEVTIALSLVADQTATYGSLLSVTATAVFLALIMAALYQGHRFPCGCFSLTEEDINSGTAVRAGALLLVALLTAYGSLHGPLTLAWAERPLYGVLAVALVALSALVASSIRVWRNNQRLELGLDWEWIVQENSRSNGSVGTQ